MGTMLKYLSIGLFLLAPLAHAASYGVAKDMVDSGAPRLALSYLESNAPADSDRAKWGALEIGLLAKFGENEKILQVAGQFPFSSEIAGIAANAAFALDKPQIAGDWIAKLIWEGKLSKEKMRQARLDAIRSLLLAQDSANAYYAMLRFSQDYRPLKQNEADLFVSGLLDANRAKDAIAWFSPLDDRDPVKIRAELETGLMSPDEVIAQSGSNPTLLLEAADRKGDASAAIGASESLVESGKMGSAMLMKRYTDSAISFSNQYSLLQGGDYGSWFDALSRIPDPHARRSLLAWILVHASDEKSRQLAASGLISELSDFPKTAVALFSGTSNLSPDARHALGAMAFKAGEYDKCASFWDGLTLQGSEPLDLARCWIESGNRKKAKEVLASTKPPMPGDRLVSLAKRMSLKSPDLLESLLPLADADTKRKILMLIADNSADPEIAAGRYFEASTLIPEKSADALALYARLSCAMNLQKAGLDEDAQAQLKWIFRNAKDMTFLKSIGLQ